MSAPIEDRLRALEVEWPQTPAFSLDALPQRTAAPRRARRRPLALGVALLLGIGAAVPDVRGAVLDVLGIGAVQIQVVEELPPLATDLGIGRAVTRGEASRLRLPLPASGRLGPAAYYARGRILTARFSDQRRAPLLVSVVRGDGLIFAKKLIQGGRPIDYVSIPGWSDGIWLEGYHGVNYLDEHGEFREDALRLSASALIWNDGPLTYRLETSLSREEALAVAASIR